MSSRYCQRIFQGLLLLILSGPTAAQVAPASHVILVTLDGVRPAEFFGGMDSAIAADSGSGVADLARLRRDYWRPTAEARRRSLMPFLWDSLAPRGVVFGDRSRSSRASITNTQGFSAPGYLEILTGQAQPEVTSNDPRRYPHTTVLEVIRDRLAGSPRGVATFASWQNFEYYVSSRDGEVFVNAGFDSLPADLASGSLALLDRLQRRALPPWNDSRLDAFTGAMGLVYL